MDSEARLMRVLSDPAAPSRDPQFTLAVIRAVEAERFRLETARSVLKAAGVAAAAAGLIVPLLSWASAHAEPLQTGLFWASGLVVAVATARWLAARATVVLRR